jgi:hypothetical protein
LLRTFFNSFIVIVALTGQAMAFEQLLEAPIWNEYPYRFGFQARWEVTRSDLANVGSQTDSFKENWLFESPKGVVSYLQSPRARVPVFRAGQSGGPMGFPEVIFIAQEDLSRLLGIPVGESPPTTAEGQDFVTIPLQPPLETAEYTLQTGEAEFFQVQLQISY